jgi:predicted ATP-dependent serine protease
MSSKKAETELLNLFERHNLGQNDSEVNTAFLVIQQVTKGGEFAGSNRFKHMMTGMAHMKWTKEGDRTFFFSKNRRGGDMSVRLFNLSTTDRVGWMGTVALGE